MKLNTLRQAFVKLDYYPSQQNQSLNPALHSLPHTLPQPKSQSPKIGDQDPGTNKNTHLIHMQVKCCECFSEKQLTPVHVYLWGYFACLLSKNKTERKKTARMKMKALYSGEVLTADDIIERLEKKGKQKLEKEQKAARAKARKG